MAKSNRPLRIYIFRYLICSSRPNASFTSGWERRVQRDVNQEAREYPDRSITPSFLKSYRDDY